MPNATDDPGILAALKRLFTPTPDPPAKPGVLQTPYADSVFALGGKPRDVKVTGIPTETEYTRTFADYTPIMDRMRIEPAVAMHDPATSVDKYDGRNTPRHILAHEEAHRLDTRYAGYRPVQSTDPGYRQAFDAWMAKRPDAQPTGYAASRGRGGTEHFAEAMADAVDLLQRTATDYHPQNADDRKRYGYPEFAANAVMAHADNLTPGADTLAIELLKRKLYAGHPLASAAQNTAMVPSVYGIDRVGPNARFPLVTKPGTPK